MSGYYDGTEPNSNHIPRAVFTATAQKKNATSTTDHGQTNLCPRCVPGGNGAQPGFKSSAPSKALSSYPFKKCGS